MDLHTAIRHYIYDKFGEGIEIKEITKLGSGLVADGYKVIFNKDGKDRKVVCRRLRGIGLSRDYLADNVGYLLLQHQISQMHPSHINSIDVVCYGESVKTVSLDGIENVFQVMEFAEGKSYIEYVIKLSAQRSLNKVDKDIIDNIVNYMFKIHSIKPHNISNEIVKHYYWRHSQDYIGSQVFMDIMDVWSDDQLLNATERTQFMTNLYSLRESLRSQFRRCSLIHSDLHPDNIRISKDSIIRPLDSARAMWGEPADDLTSMLANYIYFSLKKSGKLTGVYLDAYHLMLGRYLKLTGDKKIHEHAQIFLPVRLLILAHPQFFDKDSQKLKKQLIKLAQDILESKKFNLEELPKSL